MISRGPSSDIYSIGLGNHQLNYLHDVDVLQDKGKSNYNCHSVMSINCFQVQQTHHTCHFCLKTWYIFFTFLYSGQHKTRKSTAGMGRLTLTEPATDKCTEPSCRWRLQDSATRTWNNKVFIVCMQGDANDEADQSKQLVISSWSEYNPRFGPLDSGHDNLREHSGNMTLVDMF